MHNDKTTKIENAINIENKPKFIHVVRLWLYVFGSAKIMCIVFMALSIILSLLQPVLAFIWGNYIDSANTLISEETILPIISLALAYWLISFLANLIERYTSANEDIEQLNIVQSNRFQEMIDSKLYKKISNLNAEYIEIPKINDTINRVFGFISGRWSGLNESIMTPGYKIIAGFVAVFSVGLSLYIINPWLCIILLIAPIPTLYVTYIGNKLQFKLIKDNSKLNRETSYFQSLLLGKAAKEVKVLGLFDFFYAKWKVRADEYTIKEKKVYIKQMILQTINNTISSLAAVSANVLAIVWLANGEISIGALSAVMVLIPTLISNTSGLFASVSTVISKKNESAMFFDLMDLPEESNDGENISTIQTIRVENVKYRYPLTDKFVLDGINITIKKGERIALVGENGAGKTTFVKLISGLISPSEGDIYINDIAYDKVQSSKRLDALSAISQEPAKYTTFTIADNVFLGETQKERDEKAIDESLQFADLASIDKTLVLGKDIGGTDLSGGQWQKIAIARNHYRNRDFIVLDEPTGNLDPLAESDIFNKYLTLAKKKTLILVTHRISLASLAERIIVFSDGKIIEEGNHTELLAKNGEYARLYQTQAEWYDR